MADSSLQQQLTKYLTDAHSIEEQALAQLEVAPRLAGDPELARIFQEHLGETRGHESMTRARLEALGADTSMLKDVVMKAGAAGFLLFAKVQPDTPGKLVAHTYSYEHMELAAYELLGRVAERAGDDETVQLAKTIRDQEQAMAERLASNFDRSVAASLEDVGREDMLEQLRKYLADAHAIEAQAIKLLEKGPELASDLELASLFEEHLVETRDQQELVDARLDALGGEPSMLKDLALKRGDQLGNVLRGAPGDAGQARRVRLRLRAPRDRGLRAASPRRRAGGRRRDCRRGGTDSRAGAERGGEAGRLVRPRGRGLAPRPGRHGIARPRADAV